MSVRRGILLEESTQLAGAVPDIRRMTCACDPELDTTPCHVWRDGTDAVIPEGGADFPDRCVICNEPSGWYRHTALVSYACGRTPFSLWQVVFPRIGGDRIIRNLALPLALCLAHRRRRRIAQLVRWLGWLMVPFALVPEFFAPAIVLPAAWLVTWTAIALAGAHFATLTSARRVGGRLHLRLGKRFVASLPPSPWR